MSAPERRQYCTFLVGELFFGIGVDEVQEVIRHLEITNVPLAPPVVRGLINLRGQIVTALDMRRRLDLPDLPEGEESMHVVVRADDGAVSLLVDEIGDVVEVGEDVREPRPVTVTGVAAELISSVYKLAGRLLLVLDTDRAIGVHATAGAR